MEGTGRWVAPDTVRRPQLPAEGAGMENVEGQQASRLTKRKIEREMEIVLSYLGSFLEIKKDKSRMK